MILFEKFNKLNVDGQLIVLHATKQKINELENLKRTPVSIKV